ncbi:MAG: hypothetical protein EXR69_12985, partial [Myxococcales bacterium]|nr:hypothetical protein [Myxococcales bacterium]
WLIARTGGRATVNLVPSLIDQLDHYANGGEDLLLRLLKQPFAGLCLAQQCVLADHALLGSPRRFEWFDAFARLRDQPAASLSAADRLDRVVWGELSWFGYSALADYPDLAGMITRGSGFSQQDIDRIVQIEVEILRGIRALYQGLPEITCSPYFHPILPLLVDTSHAQRCMPGVPDPGFAWPEDAIAQLTEGRERVEAWAGVKVAGLWPSEGSVSPEVARMAKALGFSWMATDEDVLARSDPGADPGRPAIFEGMTLVFRDHALSDRVGFAYQDHDGAQASADLLGRAAGRARMVALDGENPWEHYRDAGLAFLTALLGSGETCTVSDFVRDVPAAPIATLHTGSWIDANFQIWIGHEEDRVAWRALVAARRAWDEAGRPVAARRHLYAAEGSDWFWWYGPEFSTPVSDVFDALFRAHLSAAWKAMGRQPDARLATAIKRLEDDVVLVRFLGEEAEAQPAGSSGGWQNAVPLTVRAGAMARVGGPRRLWLGVRGDRLLVRARASTGWSVGTGTERVLFVNDAASLEIRPQLSLFAPDGATATTWSLELAAGSTMKVSP